MKKSVKIEAMSFIEVLIAIVFLGVVAIVLAKFASTSLQKLIRDERTDQATLYAVNGDVVLQSIVNTKNALTRSDETIQNVGGTGNIEVFPESDKCGGYFYLVSDDYGNYSFAHDFEGNILCAIGYEQGESAIRENCIDENSLAYKYCAIPTLDGSDPEYFRYVHIDFPDDYAYGTTEYLLADVTVGQISNVNNDPTTKNYVGDYKYHTSIKLETVEEYKITINLKNATIDGKSTYVEVTEEHEKSYSIEKSNSLTGEITKYLNCRGEVDAVLNADVLDLTNIMSDVVCDVIYKERTCICGNDKVELECGEECEPSIDGEDICSSSCLLYCGNGILEFDEACEKNNPEGASYDWDNALCNHTTCKASCDKYDFVNDCGNAVKECDEDCDPKLDGEALCSNSCLWYCPDGIIETGEVCEEGNPVGAQFDWDDPKCNQKNCKECVWDGTLTVLNDDPPVARQFTSEEKKAGKVYLEKIDTSAGVTINNTSYTMEEVLETGYVKEDEDGYYVDLTLFCDVKAIVKYTKIEEVKSGSLIAHNTKSSTIKDFDIVFVIDVSGSIAMQNRQFAAAANKVIAKILSDGSNNRIGMVTFDFNSDLLLNLDRYSYVSDFLTAYSGGCGYTAKFGTTVHGGGNTRTDYGILAAKEMFLKAKDVDGRRPVFILMTDGGCYDWNGLDCTNLVSSTFDVINIAKKSKDKVSDYYGVEAGFYEMAIITKNRDTLSLVLDPSAKRIEEYYRMHNYRFNNCDFVKSLIKGTWVTCDHSEKSGGLAPGNYTENELNTMSYSDGLYVGSDMSKTDEFLEDIFNQLSTTDSREFTQEELKDRKVYLTDIDTYEEVIINGTSYDFDNLLKKGYIKKEGYEYYLDLDEIHTKVLNVEYYTLEKQG